jgi:replicative DNA helicase
MRDLTPEEQAKLDGMTQIQTSKAKYAWDDTFQRKLVGMLLVDKPMLLQALDKIQPEYFSNEAHVLIVRILFKHFTVHKEIPDKWILDNELKTTLKDRDASVQLHYQSELYTVYEYYVPGLESREYLIEKITYFAKVQAVKMAFGKSLEKISESPEDEKTWSFVYEQMRQAMLIDRSYEPGVEYFMNLDEMFKRMENVYEGKDRFTSAFSPIDEALTGGGLFTGQIAAWIGLPGTGKSLALVKGAVANVLLGHKVLYLTMEMNELGIMQRFTSQFTKLDINNLRGVKDEVYKTVENFKNQFDDPNLLYVKQFPGGTIDVNGIRAFVSQMELRKWKPNMIIIDYVGEMKDDPTVKKHESAYKIIRDLRAFGIERNHFTLTCVQPNQSAAKLEIGQYIDESNIGTSFDQFKPLDAFWSINQQVIEKDAGVGRGFVIKHRDGRSRFPFKLGFDYKLGTLDIFPIGNDYYRREMNSIQEKKAEEVVLDGISTGKKKQRSKSGFKGEEPEIETYEAG